jgi:cytochrome c5
MPMSILPARWIGIFALMMLLAGCGEPRAEIAAAEHEPLQANADTDNQLSKRPAQDSGDAAPPYDLALGETVFKRRCLTCHDKGVFDAPRLADALDWEQRAKQDLDVLIEHALNGHGNMPPKGGFLALSDQEVAAAVAYVVDRSKKIIMAMEKEQRSKECNPANDPDKCTPAELEDALILHMLYLLGTPEAR